MVLLTVFSLLSLVFLFEGMTYQRLTSLAGSVSSNRYGLSTHARDMLVSDFQSFMLKHVYQTFLFAIAVAATMIVFSHRTYGPLVSVKRFIRQLIDRQYDGELKLRKSDDLKDVASLLNELARSLRTRRD